MYFTYKMCFSASQAKLYLEKNNTKNSPCSELHFPNLLKHPTNHWSPIHLRGTLSPNVIKSSSQHQNLVCWRSLSQQHSLRPNPCVMPGQTHTGNQHKHFLLGSRDSRGEGRSLPLAPTPSLLSDLALFN